jgi:preprotein translocase subunit SecF
LLLALILVVVSIGLVAVFGLKFGIDFTGGSLLELNFSTATPAVSVVENILKPLNVGEVSIQSVGQSRMTIRSTTLSEGKHQEIIAILKNVFPALEEKRFESVGPTIGEELRKKSVLSLVLVIMAIIAYLTWTFRTVSYPVASWKYGLAAIVALIHDVTLPLGIFVILGHFFNVEINALFVTAMLTILGFSVYDTIVIFDRIRENLLHNKNLLKIKTGFRDIVNNSINQSIARSVNTSFSAILVLLAIFFFGGESVKYFVLALMLGMFFGTYSSIFVASSLLVLWQKRD